MCKQKTSPSAQVTARGLYQCSMATRGLSVLMLCLVSLWEAGAFVGNRIPFLATRAHVSITEKGPLLSKQGASTMIRPLLSSEVPAEADRPYYRVEIEYCPGCRWLLRAGWLAQELLMTFQADIDEVAIKPSKESGTFNVRVNSELVFSRRAEGRFPEAKEVKQLVRNIACPDKGLGHSDSPLKQE